MCASLVAVDGSFSEWTVKWTANGIWEMCASLVAVDDMCASLSIPCPESCSFKNNSNLLQRGCSFRNNSRLSIPCPEYCFTVHSLVAVDEIQRGCSFPRKTVPRKWTVKQNIYAVSVTRYHFPEKQFPENTKSVPKKSQNLLWPTEHTHTLTEHTDCIDSLDYIDCLT
jgi:hypothetical protein